MDSSPSASSSAPRRHLKRLSLSVASSPRHGDARTQAIAVNADSTDAATPPAATPERRFNNSNGSQSAVLLSRSAGPGSSSSSAGASGRRVRPTSMYASSPGAGFGASTSSNSLLAADSSSPSPFSKSALPSLPEDGDALEQHQQESFSPTSSISRAGNSFNGKRSLLGRSPHARRQSSISYARSNGSDSGPSTPKSSIVLNRGDVSASTSSTGVPTPASAGSDKSDYFPSQDEGLPAASQDMVPVSSTTSINEMNVGMIGAKSADLLTFIAKKERRCMDLREELKKHEDELVLLKKKWEAVVQREMQSLQNAASPAAQANVAASASSSPVNTLSPLPATQGLFSSLTSSLTASSSSANSSPAGTSTSPSPKPPSAGNRRLLTARHSISVASPSRAGNSGNARTGFLGGSDLSKQDSASSNEDSASVTSSEAAAYDMSKMARSWLGGMVKSASSVLETLAVPPPASNDLDTVREEEEPEEEEDGKNHPGPSRTSAGHPSAHGRKVSEATLGNETSSSIGSGSPSSSFEEGRFSSATSRSSSVSSMHSDAASKDLSSLNTKGGDDITPVATPVMETAQTPKGGNSSAEADDLWGLSGFEDEGAREARETRERERMQLPEASPPRPAPASRQSLASASKAAHGRRRSTAFELGGAWGSIVGKKWNEVANSEVLKKSTRATMNFVDTFEKTLTDAMAIDGSPRPDGSSPSPSMAILDGDYHPWMDHAPAQAAPEQREKGQDRSLPSGIGGAASWTALLSGGSGKKATTPKQRAEEWQRENSPSPSSAATAKQQSLLDEQSEEEARDTFAPLPLPRPAKQQQLDTPQSRLQASRAKHSKRMSLPSNLLVGEQRKSTLGLGLDSLNEEDDKAEAEDGWGW